MTHSETILFSSWLVSLEDSDQGLGYKAVRKLNGWLTSL